MATKRSKTAVITGASQGIGRAIALRLADRGVETILAGRDSRRLAELVQQIVSAGGRARHSELDLADEASIRQFTDDLTAARSELGILVNCAGRYLRGRWEDSSASDLAELLGTNVSGVFSLTRGVLPLLVRARGDIVFVNSSIVLGDGRGAGLYAATKHALKGLADSLRAEVNERGVRVLSVYPGRTATPMQERAHGAENRAYEPDRLLQPGDVAEAVVACLELGETAEVTDLMIRPRYK